MKPTSWVVSGVFMVVVPFCIVVDFDPEVQQPKRKRLRPQPGSLSLSLSLSLILESFVMDFAPVASA